MYINPIEYSNFPLFTNCKNVDLSKLEFPKLNDKYILYCNPTYEYIPNTKKPLIFKTEPINFIELDTTLINNETFKIPFYPDQNSCLSLFKLLKGVDDLIINKFTKLILKKYKNYNYCHIIKTYEITEKNKIQFCRVNFCKDFNNNINTSIFINKDNKCIKKNIKNFEEISKYLKWNSKVQFIIQIDKFWLNTRIKNTYNCGLKLLCLQMEILENHPDNLKDGDNYKNENINQIKEEIMKKSNFVEYDDII